MSFSALYLLPSNRGGCGTNPCNRQSQKAAEEAYQTVAKELAVGLVNGLCTGIIVFLAALIFNGNPLLGLVLFLAMICNLIVAGITGSAIPLILKRAGIDPAVSSSILITTFTDTAGFWLTYFLAAKIILKL